MDQRWFAIQTILRHSVSDGVGTYVERIVLYRARSADAAEAEARQDVQEYLSMNEGVIDVKVMSTFEVESGRTDLNACEVWANAYRGSADPEEFYRERYIRFAVDADE